MPLPLPPSLTDLLADERRAELAKGQRKKDKLVVNVPDDDDLLPLPKTFDW